MVVSALRDAPITTLDCHGTPAFLDYAACKFLANVLPSFPHPTAPPVYPALGHDDARPVLPNFSFRIISLHNWINYWFISISYCVFINLISYSSIPISFHTLAAAICSASSILSQPAMLSCRGLKLDALEGSSSAGQLRTAGKLS